MEVIDVGSVDIEDVIERLLEPGHLGKLIGYHGVACFALVHTPLAPHFYELLVENAPTIDATTRRHIAFIVFYGSDVTVQRRAGTEYAPYIESQRIHGFSISEETNLMLEDAGFDAIIAQRLRTEPRREDVRAIARQMTYATTALLERFGIDELNLPCLLFVDAQAPKEPVVVRLDSDDPSRSLYEDVLTPLSREFRELARFWGNRDRIQKLRAGLTRAEATVVNGPGQLASAGAALEEARDRLRRKAELAHERCERLATLQSDLDSVGKDPVALAQFSSVSGEAQHELESLRQVAEGLLQCQGKLEAIQARTIEFRSSEQRLLAEGELSRSIVRRRHKLLSRRGNLRRSAGDQQEALGRAVRRAEQEVESQARAVAHLDAELSAAKSLVATEGAGKLAEDETTLLHQRELLVTRGYGESVLGERPAALGVVRALVEHRRLGARRNDVHVASASPLKILFVAANPLTTAALDLEEELRAVARELQSTKYRDDISLCAKHAVRAEDLVQHLRREQPRVLHFSGHGSVDGILLRSENGEHLPVSGDALRRLLEGRGVDLVVLNCCSSRVHAEGLRGAVSAVVGTSAPLPDDAARRFSVAFYRALGDGLNLGNAFRDGVDSVTLYGHRDVFFHEGWMERHLLGNV